MIPDRWTYVLLLVTLAGGRIDRDAFADDLQVLSRSVRWTNVPLQDTPPADLSVNIPHDVTARRYAEFVYGTPDSRRVAVVVAEPVEGQFFVYVDQNRDRNIQKRDLVTGEGELRILSLAAEKVVGVIAEHFPRRVLLRWAGGKADLSIATTTRIEHSIYPDRDETSQALSTRQIDGNANGLFADSKDWLQIDLNDDDRFDPFLETFPFRPLMEFRGQRWFAKADRFGKWLRLESATATGRLRLATRARSEQDQITELVVTLSGEDGSVVSLTGVNATTELPVGRYAAAVLFVTIKGQESDRAWEFTFSRDGSIRGQDWLQIKEDKTVEFDPIGELVLDAAVEASPDEDVENLNLQPRLFTGSGLLINLCRIDGMSSWSGPKCHVSLLDAGNQSLGQSDSGFS